MAMDRAEEQRPWGPRRGRFPEATWRPRSPFPHRKALSTEMHTSHENLAYGGFSKSVEPVFIPSNTDDTHSS